MSCVDLNLPLAIAPSEGIYAGLADLDFLYNATRYWFTLQDRYWGVTPATATHAPAGTVHGVDHETLVRTGPVRLHAGMGWLRAGGIGACTLCSEWGCAQGMDRDFALDRFTSKVTEGTMVCLIERGLTPPDDCPGNHNVP